MGTDQSSLEDTSGSAASARERTIALCRVPRSLKNVLEEKAEQSGFASLVDCVRTVLRDLITGRIEYSNGCLVSQPQNPQTS